MVASGKILKSARLLLIIGIWARVFEELYGQETTSAEILHVHVVPHTHDDVGWLKTVDQYYYGRNNTIQHACVSCILDSLIYALEQNPKRKFTYVEMAFFSMWWGEQTQEMKSRVHKLVQDERLAFVNGGWCMHDEATTHFMGMIDQTTLGHDFLKEELDYIPSVGWQLDPFGHSSTQASLMTSEVGFNALYFGRIDYQDRDQRHSSKNCEGIWDASRNLKDTSVFWGLTGSYKGNYGAPGGFCFDVLCDEDGLFGLDDETLRSQVNIFMKAVKEQASRTRGNHIMLTMGSDFQYENAMVNFKNLDLLIDSINSMDETIDGFDGFVTFYSNPEIYTKAKYDEFTSDDSNASNEWDGVSIKTDDFFPYSDCEHCFWTGYFTSRPALKRLERVGSSFLHAARQIQTFYHDYESPHPGVKQIYNLEKAMGIAQHHDGVSGTSKQHVAFDYAKKIQAGINEVSLFITQLLDEKFFGLDGDALFPFSYFQLRNISVCNSSQFATMSQNVTVYVAVYNALGWERSDILSLPVSTSSIFSVTRMVDDKKTKYVDSALHPNMNAAKVPGAAPFNLVFDTGHVKPASLTLYKITNKARSSLEEPPLSQPATKFKESTLAHDSRRLRALQATRKTDNKDSKPFVVENGIIELNMKSNGASKIKLMSTNTTLEMHLEWGFYRSFQVREDNDVESIYENPKFISKHTYPWRVKDSLSSQNSGAYIFRPSVPDEELQIIKVDPTKTKIHRSNLMTEIIFGFEVPWIKQTLKMFKGKKYIDVEYTVGPIPVNDDIGKEIALRIGTNIDNKGVFFTDSNGREFIKRKRSNRSTWNFKEFQPVAGNYYPVNSAIFMEDSKTSLAIITDRTQGGTSLRDGSLELMVHRRTIKDDGRGVGEPINETVSMSPYPPYGDAKRLGEGLLITGTHRILIGEGNDGACISRKEMDTVFSPLHMFVTSGSPDEGTSTTQIPVAALRNALPSNVQLITVKLLSSSTDSMKFLFRLGHGFAKGESTDLSEPVMIDLSQLFTGYEVKSMIEKSLSGNQDRSVWDENKMIWGHKSFNQEAGKPNLDRLFSIKMNPMEIRTFEIHAARLMA